MELIRKPLAEGELPNIRPQYDYRMLHYAVGGAIGYNKDFGSGFDYQVSGNTFKVLSGELVCYGAQARVEAVGEEFDIAIAQVKKYCVIYAEVDLRNSNDNKATLIVSTSETGYPVIDEGDNLTQNQNGVARVVMFKFTATNGIIAEVQKVVKEINYSSEEIEEFKSGIENGTVVAKNADNAIKHTNNTYSGFINEEGILKTGESVIRKKKLLYSGMRPIGYDDKLILNVGENIDSRKFEVKFMLAEIHKQITFEIFTSSFQTISQFANYGNYTDGTSILEITELQVEPSGNDIVFRTNCFGLDVENGKIVTVDRNMFGMGMISGVWEVFE